ncbi:amidase family protein [Acidomonas methanolica]|uniref:amidase family protein n=1 Tax=Acidomonas methanolica TaxID=437 RepID=UPI00211A3E29|nr:amidase family protein [Acidomonas methanolica]
MESYRSAQKAATEARERAERLFDIYDALIAPAAPGVAPLGLASTGDPVFSRLRTLLRLPTVTLPGLTGENGLPIGIQLLGRLDADEDLLAHAAWAETALPRLDPPSLVSTL